MKIKLLFLLAVTSTGFAMPSFEWTQQNEMARQFNRALDGVVFMLQQMYQMTQKAPSDQTIEIEEMLRKEASTLNPAVVAKVMTTLECAKTYHLDENNILTIIDYSMPSSDKRLWVFDLNHRKLLFNTYVSHGIKSGVLSSNFFSNKYNSKASSMGVYKTDKSYNGRHGLSLRLQGLDKGFNDNASNRAVVMHGGWYVDEQFIKKYGRAGRSWGCPAVPTELTKPIINTIKDNSIFVVYYPDEDWFVHSKFLNCTPKALGSAEAANIKTAFKPAKEDPDFRDNILFADLNKNNKREESEPVVVVSADQYKHLFQKKPPLERMLRRQINNVEYIALSNQEFKDIVTHLNAEDNRVLNEVYFVIPVVKMVRGYYATEMQFVNLGKIKGIGSPPHLTDNNNPIKNFTVDSEKRSSISLKSSNAFIRWLGL